MDECVKTKYDTYIEYKFFEKLDTCIKNAKNRERIRTAWLNDKALYTDLTKTIEFEFVHYSLHDASHSINILQCIYMLLGKNKIDKLSVGDLWLLLESAYSHDIGMATCYEELKELWQNDSEIEKQVRRISVSADRDIISMYKKVRDWIESNGINQEIINVFKEHNEWPLEIRKAVTYINSEYIRQLHAERSKDKILGMLGETSRLKIEDRLYKAVGKIDYLHGTDFKEIFNLLKTQAIGFETDKIHPRLIAQLLRVGDSLDIRNNRFDYSNIKYQGGLSGISNLHYEKHRNVTHFLIDDTKVQIYIESSDINVCRNARDWFDIIENQIALLMKHWNAFSPRCLGGFKLSDIDLKVKYKGNIFKFENFDKVLKADPGKVLDILIGSNVYSTNLVCFREYLQNAIDATKMRIADELNNIDFLESMPYDKLADLTPEDIDKNYFKQYEIRIEIDYEDRDSNLIKFNILDQGIGMDKEGIQALCNIGTGWNGRSNAKRLLLQMPEWLKPTGGFGIGLLSGFLLTDKIKIYTKSKKDSRYCIDVYTPKTGLQIEQTIDSDYYGPIGTEVSFVVPFEKYYKEVYTYLKNIQNNSEFQDKNHSKSNFTKYLETIGDINITEQQLLFVEKTLEHLINEYIVDTVIPINISNRFSNSCYSIDKQEIYSINSKDDILQNNLLWFSKRNTLISVKTDIKQESNLNIGFRGIKASNITIGSNKTLGERMNNLCSTCFKSIDIFDGKVNDILMLNRDEIKDNAKFIVILENIIEDYLNYLIENELYNAFSNHFEKIMLYFLENRVLDPNLISLLPKDYYKVHAKEFIPIDIISKTNKLVKLVDEVKSCADDFNDIRNTDEETKKNNLHQFVNNFKKEYIEYKEAINQLNISSGDLINTVKSFEILYDIINTEEIKNLDTTKISQICNNINEIKEDPKEISMLKTSLIKELFERKEVYLIVNGKILPDSTIKKKKLEYDEILFTDKSINDIKNQLNEINIFMSIKYDYDQLSENSYLVHINRIEKKQIENDFSMYNAVVNSLTSGKDIITINYNTIPQLENEYGALLIDYIYNNFENKCIINPFKLNYGDKGYFQYIIDVLKQNEINGRQLSYDKIQLILINFFEKSSKLKNIINLVFEMQNGRYTKDEIKSQYINLIYSVVIVEYNNSFG